MNSEIFFRYIEKTRDCDIEKLDLALLKGIRMAKNDRIHPRKFLMLAAASVFTFAMCIIINLAPVKSAVDVYYINWHFKMSDSSEILNGYIIDIINDFKKYLGGE